MVSNKYICDNYLVQKYKLTFFQAVEVRKVCQKPNRICTQKPYNGFFFTPKQEIRAFRHYFFSLLLTEKWFLCDMERVALFFLSRFGDNSVTIDGDLKQKLVRFDKIFFFIYSTFSFNIQVRGCFHKFFESIFSFICYWFFHQKQSDWLKNS